MLIYGQNRHENLMIAQSKGRSSLPDCTIQQDLDLEAQIVLWPWSKCLHGLATSELWSGCAFPSMSRVPYRRSFDKSPLRCLVEHPRGTERIQVTGHYCSF